MLPKTWHRSTLGEIARISSGGTPDRSKPEYWGGDVPWVTTGEIQFKTITDTAEKITAAGLQNSSAKLFPPGTLLMAMYGQGKTRGQVAKLGIEATTNQNSAAILLNDEHDPDYYFQFLSSQYENIRDFGHSGGISHLNAGLLKQIAVPVAPINEQRCVARILATWDQSIATAEKLIANGQRQVEALLQHLLIKPAQRGEWNTFPIGEISERVQRRANEDEDLPVLMISSGSGFVRQDEKYSRFMAGKSVENYIALDRGEFAYNKGNSKLYEFGCVFVLKGYERGLVPNVYVCFKISAELNAAFYEHLFRADYLHDQLGALVNTGVRNNGLLNIRPVDFLACKVPVPPLDVQGQIANVLTTAVNWVEKQERDLELLKQEKAALMSQLLTGKRRVKLPDAETAAQV
jgi:type I restriction enzyme S subunit